MFTQLGIGSIGSDPVFNILTENQPLGRGASRGDNKPSCNNPRRFWNDFAWEYLPNGLLHCNLTMNLFEELYINVTDTTTIHLEKQ